MKRAFTLLLLILIVLYARESYNTYLSAFHVKEGLTGVLSDIAKEVKTISLQPVQGKHIGNIKHIQQAANDLFLISEDILYRYNKNGDFICQITHPADINVAGYLLNPLKEEIIVLGNTNDIFYYSFDGELIEQKKLANDLPNRKILSMSLFNDRIVSMEENCYIHPDTQEILVEKELVTYDTSFRKIESRELVSVDLGRPQYLLGLTQPQLCVDGDTGHIFVYAPSLEPDYLLQDTLLLTYSWGEYMQTCKGDRQVPVVPIRPVGLYWFSSYQQHEEEDMNYIFCFNMKTHHYKRFSGGLKDDFYQTGLISGLQAMDLHNDMFCFTQSGESVRKTFPESNAETVIFIVKMKEA